jgi:2-oxoisovalerate ferredoxin oxidoreductase beta subunit
MNIKKAVGFYDTFERSGSPTRDTHYCPGCGHGILHKLICEALVDLGLQDRTVIVNPIGCAVFGYYYWDAGNVGAAHGRAQAVATAMNRTLPGRVVIAYQGDGDLGAIGFNCTFQAASRGEHFATFFVNNAIYGMTGGQLAPTTLLGQKTTTSPIGRSAAHEGYPLHVCETLNQLKAPVYIARCSLADTTRIMQARQAVRKALEIQRDGKGYAFVEFLSPCPTNLRLDAVKAAKFVTEKMETEFPLGRFRDESAASPARALPPPTPAPAEFFSAKASGVETQPDPAFVETRMKVAGYGGQGILSLGLAVAEAGRLAGQHASWFPSYGPEQRGGAASCTVVVSGRPIGSPDTTKPDVLVCMNRPSFERFAPAMRSGGLVICDALVGVAPGETPEGVRLVVVPAMELAAKLGVPRAANTVMLAALSFLNATGLPQTKLIEALDASFAKKPKLIPVNRNLFEAATTWCGDNLQAARS